MNEKIKNTFMHIISIPEVDFFFKGLTAGGEVDIGLAPFVVRKTRAKVVDYLISNENFLHGYFYIKNPRDTYDWTVFFLPLWKEAWIGLMVFAFVTPILIAMIVFIRK